jgi:hypothetical protein
MSKWTPERLKKDRESWEAKNNSRTTNRTASTGTAAGTANTTDKWTPERIAKARESWEAKSSGQNAASPAAAARQNTGTGLGARVLAQMTGADSSHKLQLAVPQETGRTQAYPGKNGIVTGSGTGTHSSTAQPEWLNAKNTAAPAAKVTGTVQPTERQRIAGIASGDEGWYAQTAQKVKQYTEDLKATDDVSDFDRLNQWMDADPKHRELVTLMRIGTGGQSYAEKNNAMQPQSVSGVAASAAVPEKSAGRRDYTDAELLAKEYSRKEISEARQYIADFDALPAGQRAARRAANTIGGIGDTVASSVFLAGETGVQSAKNAAATSSNWKQLQQDVQSDDRQQELLRLMTGGKTRYAARDNTLQLAQSSGAMASAPTAQTTQSDAYTDAELIEKGYTQQEIDNMRARIAGTEVHDSVDPEKSFGYQLYKRGQDLTAAAQAGLSPIAKQALGIVSSAGENLAVAAIDPAWVLPVLSAQGGAEAMGQSIEKGESAGKTLAGGLAKFGAGWAINSVGAADLAKTMGSDYAKDALAGKLADMVRSVAADGTLAQQYPAVANAVSGGVDNAMQAFVETYADKAIDATLGDSEAAADLFKSDTFLTALESGLTGGASGALGGAVGTGLAKANGGDASIVGNVKRAYYEGQAERARQALQDEVRAQEPVAEIQDQSGTQPQQTESELLQPPAGGSSLGEGALGPETKTAGIQNAANEPVTERQGQSSTQLQQSDSGQGYSVSVSNDAMTVRFADGTEVVQKVDLEDVSNVGNLNEKLTVLRESYEREMKQEVKRLKAERQEMLDEAKLWYRERMGELREENADLSMRLREEQRRADKAEYSLIVQENEIMEWEADNERKRAAWEQKQAQRNALAIETARQQRDEDIAVAKAVAEKRVQRARDARKMDELKRSIRQNAAQLNQMLLRPSKDKYVQPGLIDAAAQVAKLADMTILNERAVNQLTRLQDRIRQSAGSENSPNAMTEEWKQTGVDTLIQTLRDDLQTTKDTKLTKLHEQLAEAEVLPDSEKAWALQERLRKRIKETENRTYLPMTVDQMRMLKAITSSTLHVIRNANKTVSLAKAEEVSAIAEGAASEVNASKGNHPGGKLDGVHNLLTKYQLDMLGAERVFRMLGGYAKNGQMEKMAQMLNDGQYRQTKITVEGEKLFANVTGKEHVKKMQNFAGPGADLVDVGLTDVKGKKAELTHAQLCSLYMHLHNTDSLNHLMNGGLVIPDAKLYNKGDIEQAYQKGQTVHLGMLTDADGTPTADSILQTVEAAMTDYDRAWCADMKEFFDNYTTKLINETSLQLVGYQRATVKNYYPIAVDKSVLATQIDGLNLDATIEGRGFLKNRVKSGQPILLEECANVVQRSLRDTAAYAGLAAPIRDVQKILNSGVETREGLANLKNGIIKEQWGKDAVSYIDDLLTDLQTTQRKRPSTFNKVLGNLRGNYAGAVLTLNPGVAIAQAASLPTAAAVLGGDTMAAVVPFVKNLSPKARTALETEIKEHGDVLLDWRKRGSQNGKQETLAEKGMDKLPNWLTGWINGMDEVTVAALWEGSKRYVQHHTAEFEGAEVTGSPAYWEAVNRTYQKVIEQTQPNYTVMQRAGIQRNPNELLKQLTMFTTQRFQNYGILADAIGDYKAQAERYRQNQSDENKAELQRAKTQRNRAVVSQAAQTAVFAIMKIGADFLLHRWDREQDENGDMTVKSMWKRFASLYTESFAGNFLYGSELYSLIDNAMNGKDYDVLSAASISVVNDLAGDVQKFFAEFRKDTSEMDEEQLQKHHDKLLQRSMTLLEDSFEVAGVPYGNGRKIVEAVKGYYGDLENLAHGGQFSFNSVPQSATGQYDRLYNAYAGGDSDEAKAAVEKLNAMVEAGTIAENKMYSQLKSRLVKYDVRVRQAAEEQNAGNDQKRYELENEMIEQLSEVLGLPKGKRGDVVDCVTGAVNQLAETQLKGDNASVTDDLVEAVDSWDAGAVQEEYDRLAKAGKSATTLKSKITETAKPEYLAGSDADRQQMEEMLLALKDADGEELYTEKNFAQWVEEAEKKAEEGPKPDPYAAVR